MLARAALVLALAFAPLKAGASPLAAQSVAAAGQPPATPGRFGFALECVAGCTWVEQGIDHAYFRFGGEPRVSAVAKASTAQRAGLKVGDIIVAVDSEHVASAEAGLALASDTVERLQLTVRNEKGKERRVILWSIRVCAGTRGLVVQNHSGYDADLVMSTRRRTRVLSTVPPGTSNLPIPLGDSLFRAAPPYFYVRMPYAARRVHSSTALAQMWSTRVVCHEEAPRLP
jgi:membrane-associated protease RseP (regulator of RpoE activity)